MSILTVPQTKCPPIAPKLIGFPVLPVALIALAKTVLHVAFSGRYGWHRDELYLFSMGRHLDAGSVDVAPLTPTVAHLVDLVAGPSLVALRATTAFAGALTVVVVALTARELGGRRYGQIGAALAAATCPLLLGTNGLFQPVSFDQLVWSVVLLLVVRLLRTRDAVWLVPLGGAVGVGIETKYTVLGLVAALVTVIAPSKRARTILRTRQVILAAAVALLVAAPNLWWQATHGWPSIAFFTGHNGEVRAEYPPSKYLLELCMLAGVAGLPLCIAGAVWLWRTTTFRPLAVCPGVVVVGMLVAGGKGYYAAPALLVLFAAGAVAMERRAATRARQLRQVLLLVLPMLVGLPIGVAVLPAQTMVHLGLTSIRSDYAEELGWPELVDTVTAAYVGLPSSERDHLAILTRNYGEAGALTLLAGDRTLPPVVSGHLAFGDWPLARPDAKRLLVVGYSQDDLRRYCTATRVVATVTNRYAVDNEENGGPVMYCELRRPLAESWPQLKHY